MKAMKMSRFALALTIAIVALFAVTSLHAAVTVIQPSSQDSYMHLRNNTTNYGSSTTLNVQADNGDHERAVVQFDLSSIPGGATINFATLELYATTASSSRAYDCHRVTTSWTEGGVTWSNPWGTAGGDFATPTSSIATGTSTGWKIWNVQPLVQGWVDSTYVNNGFLIKDSLEVNARIEWQFASKENGTTANRPILRIDYTSVCGLTGATVTPSGATTFCSGGSVNLVAGTTGTPTGPLNYSWAPGGATTQTITVSTSGTYTVTVTDAGEPGCNATSADEVITVNPNPTATITPSGATTFCAGGSVNLVASDSGAGTGPYSWLWAPGGATTQTINVSASGTYTVTVTDSNTCSDVSGSTVVTVNPNPTVTISADGPTSFCDLVQNSVDLTANPAGGSGSYTGYLWAPGGATTQTINVTTSGAYTVTVTDTNGCQGTSPVENVTVWPLPTPTITVTDNCPADSVLDAGVGYASYLWAPGGATTQTITVTNDGTLYTVTVTDGNACPGQDTANAPTCVICGMTGATITPGGPTTFCDEDNVDLVAGTTGTPTGPLTYSWAPGGATTQTITVATAGTWTVTVTDTGEPGCNETSAGEVITIWALPTPTITVTDNCPADSVLDAGAGFSAYLWAPGGATTQTITVTNDGTLYTVTVTDANGCSGNDSANAPTCTAGTVTVIPWDLAPPTVYQGKPGVGMERLGVVISSGTASWTDVKVDLYTTGAAADGDLAVNGVKIYDDSGSLSSNFDAGDALIGQGTMAGGMVTITFGAAETITTTTQFFYIIYDINAAATIGNEVGIRIVDNSYFTMSETVNNTNMPFNSTDSLIIAPMMSVVATDQAPASVNQGQTGVAMERLAVSTNYSSLSWSALQVDLFTTDTAFDSDVANIHIYDDAGGSPGTFDGGDNLIDSGTFSAGTVTLTLGPEAVNTSASNYFLVFDIDAVAVAGHKVGIRVADAVYFTVSGSVNSGGIPFNSTDSLINGPAGEVPGQILDFDATDGENIQSTLTWTNPPDPPGPATLAEILVRRKVGSYPANNTDGAQVFQDLAPTPDASNNVVDNPLVNGTIYYYAVFSQSSDTLWNDNVDATKNADTGMPQGVATSPPTALMISPIDGATIGGTVTIKIDAWDADNLAGANEVEVSFDGAAWSTATLNTNYPNDATRGIYEYTWDTVAALGANADQAVSIFYRATDSAANTSNPRVTAVNVRNTGGAPAGDGMLLHRDNDAQLCMDCHALEPHSSRLTGTKYGNWGVTCRTCHTPHNTTNIHLIKNQIRTPNNGVKAVDFRSRTGAEGGAPDYDMADDFDGVYTNICEVCHTQTNYHRNNASTPITTHNNGKDCIGCHLHEEGFKGGGEGGADCNVCHSDLTDAMDAGSTGSYHHYMQNFSETTPYPSDNNPTAEDTDRRCIQCHAKHDVFSPAKNALSPGRSYNLRTDINLQPDTTSNYTNTDFDSGLPNGGICVSCHFQAQTKSPGNQKDDGTTATLVINQTAYANSAHNQTSPSIFGTDTSTFNANCSRCHTDTMSPKSSMGAQTSATKFGLHDSSVRRLLNPMGGAASDPLEETFCYQCHATGTGLDYYGNAMTAAASDIQAAFTAGGSAHPILATSAVHLQDEDQSTPDWNPNGSRHVECGDCHNPHAAQAGTHTPGTGNLGAANIGVSGVTVTNAAGTRNVNYAFNAAPAMQYELCLKCHSTYGWGGSPPQTLSLYPDSTTWTQTDVGDDFDVDNFAHHAVFGEGKNQPPDNANPVWDTGDGAGDGDKWEPGDGTGTGLSNNFVDGWGQHSIVACTDCHDYSDPAGPRGPHGSAYRWLLKGVNIYVTVTLAGGDGTLYPNMGSGYDTGGTPDGSDASDFAFTRENFCINCHRGDVYSWGSKGEGPDGQSPPAQYADSSRIEHGGGSNSDMGTDLETGKGTRYPIGCMNCHGGSIAGGIHGSIQGVGNKGENSVGYRFMNGSSWDGHTLADDPGDGNIGCYTKGAADSLTTCKQHPGGNTNMKPYYYYDIPGQ